jgi:pimeloyl-ACP methyl ester carboxylesterase
MTAAERVAAGPVPFGGLGGLGGHSRWVDLDGPVHYLDFGGPANGPLIVAVHGLGGAAVNWSSIAPLLTRKYRLLAPDLAGHGLTKSGGRGTDVASNRSLLHRFAETVAAGPVLFMGNSMGGMIGLLEASAAPEKVAGLILLDPALPIQAMPADPLVAAVMTLSATPVLGPLLVRQRRLLPVEQLVTSTFALCCADSSRVPREMVELHIEVARARAAMSGNGKDFAHAARSVLETAGFLRGQAYRRAIRQVDCPVLMIHGERDRLVPVAAARAMARAHPDWTLVVLSEVGHVPQLEASAETADAVIAWLTGAGASAARAAKSRRPSVRRRQPQRLRDLPQSA